MEKIRVKIELKSYDCHEIAESGPNFLFTSSHLTYSEIKK
jgi:hypothetical protein